MPRGKYVNHKGRNRHFISPEEWTQASDESSEEETTSGGSGNEEKDETNKVSSSGTASSSGLNSDTDDDDISDDEEDLRYAKKGVASLIEIANPNRVVPTLNLLDMPTKPELSRRERKQTRYEKLHAAGKTTEAMADLARLAIIRQQRAEAAAKREANKKLILAIRQQLCAEAAAKCEAKKKIISATRQQQRAEAAGKREADKKIISPKV